MPRGLRAPLFEQLRPQQRQHPNGKTTELTSHSPVRFSALDSALPLGVSFGARQQEAALLMCSAADAMLIGQRSLVAHEHSEFVIEAPFAFVDVSISRTATSECGYDTKVADNDDRMLWPTC